MWARPAVSTPSRTWTTDELATSRAMMAMPTRAPATSASVVSIGVESAYPVARDADEIKLALADPVGTLAARAERVARTWSH